jgi:hypothetical protein
VQPSDVGNPKACGRHNRQVYWAFYVWRPRSFSYAIEFRNEYHQKQFALTFYGDVALAQVFARQVKRSMRRAIMERKPEKSYGMQPKDLKMDDLSVAVYDYLLAAEVFKSLQTSLISEGATLCGRYFQQSTKDLVWDVKPQHGQIVDQKADIETCLYHAY